MNIVEIIPRCGPNMNSICDETTLKTGDVANFGVIFYNDSPTGMAIVGFSLN